MLLLSALLPANRAVRRLLRLHRIEQTDTKKAAVAIYQTALDASAFGESVPDDIRRCAEKAVFSRRGVTAEELAAAGEALDALLREQLQRRSPFGAFVFRYWQGLA